MPTFIPYGTQEISEEDISEVIEVLSSEFLTQGQVVPRFEKEISEYVNAKYVTLVNSATSALHLACIAMDLKAGDIVWTSPITFVASSNCVLYCGAAIDFVDIDLVSYNICVSKLAEKLYYAKRAGKLPKALIVVHFAGRSCNMQEIYELSKKFGFRIIEDASHAIGAIYSDGFVGSCQFSDITIFSFHPVKIITTGEGGALLTNDQNIFFKASLLRSHGITKNPDQFLNKADGDWYYEQQALGFNYRMTEFQAALGRSQLKKIDYFLDIRRRLAENYHRLLIKMPLVLADHNSIKNSSNHLYVIRVDTRATDKKRLDLYVFLKAANIGVNLHYIPVYRQPYYAQFNFNFSDFPNAEEYYSSALSIPMHSKVTPEIQLYIVSKIEEFFSL